MMTNGREENRELFEDNISEKVTHNQEGNESSYNKDDDSLSLTSEEQPSKVVEHIEVLRSLLLLVCAFLLVAALIPFYVAPSLTK